MAVVSGDGGDVWWWRWCLVVSGDVWWCLVMAVMAVVSGDGGYVWWCMVMSGDGGGVW